MSKHRLLSSPLGAQLRAHRKSLKVTQSELANRVGCSLPTIGQAERGEGRVDTFQRLSAAMDMEISGRSLPPGEHLGARLSLLRRRRGISRRSLAALSEVSTPTIAALEGGAMGHLAQLERVAIALGAGLCLVPEGKALSFWRSAGTSSAYQAWTTPPELLEKLYPIVGGKFGLDPCSPTHDRRSAPVRAQLYFTVQDDGLTLPWVGSTFVNPPFGRNLSKWVAKARQESEARRAAPVIGLLPARPDTRWWHQYVVGIADAFLLRGRLRFGGAGGQTAPFPSALILWGSRDGERDRMREAFPDAWYVPARA